MSSNKVHTPYSTYTCRERVRGNQIKKAVKGALPRYLWNDPSVPRESVFFRRVGSSPQKQELSDFFPFFSFFFSYPSDLISHVLFCMILP